MTIICLLDWLKPMNKGRQLFNFPARKAGFGAWIGERFRANSFPCVNAPFSFACLRVRGVHSGLCACAC